MLSIGSLFSGIGGIEKGLEQAGFGPTLWQCEINPFRRAVLSKHWPNALLYDDIYHVYRPRYVDVICGGFPCQPFSTAAHQQNVVDLNLWKQFNRVIAETKPKYTVVENVANYAAKKWLPTVRQDLHMHGYRTRALRIDARDVGAPHARARIFVVGYADQEAQPARTKHGEVAGVSQIARLGGHWRKPLPRALRMAHGVPGSLDRLAALGEAVVPAVAEVVGRIILQMENA